MKTYIEIGDTVVVSFNNSQYTLSSEALLLSYPTAIGDSWIVKDLKTGQIHYISEGCTITLIKKSAINDYINKTLNIR